MSLELKVTPRRAGLIEGRDNHLDVLVRALGPENSQEATLPKSLNLSLVIDRSGSMNGRPLEEAKRCASAIVDQLKPTDFVSVVAYDSEVELVWPALRADNRSAIKQAIQRIDSGDMTALHDGWVAGAEQAALNVSRADISRVLVLSDGAANEGLTNVGAIAAQCAQMADKRVSTSTYGLGSHFNEELMFAMARSGGGNAYYGQTADDLMSKFQEEFDLLKALCARNVRLRLSPAAGVTAEVANGLANLDGAWRLPDVAYGSEAWVLVRLSVPRVAWIGDTPLLSATLTWEDETGAAAAAEPIDLALPGLSEAAHAELVDDELVARRAREVRFAEFQRQAGDAAKRGDWDLVEQILAEARREAADHEWLTASLASLEDYARRREQHHFAKEARYKYNRMSLRLVDRNEGAAYSSVEEDSKASYLRRKREEGRGG